MGTRLFSNFDLKGPTIEQFAFYEQCSKLYASILQNSVNEELFDDFCDCLQHEDFFEAAKSEFPVLRGLSDKLVPDTAVQYLGCLEESTKLHVREPYPLPAVHDEAVFLVRHFLTTLSNLVFNKKGIQESVRTGLYSAFAALFEATGGAIPAYLDDYLEGKTGAQPVVRRGVNSLSRSGRRAYPGAAAQPDNILTETGVYNGLNTCYQNVVFRLMLSSTAITANLARPQIEGFFNEGDTDATISFRLFKLLRAIKEGSFDLSKACLKLLWAALRKKDCKWAPGRQNDADEFVHIFPDPFRECILDPSWEHDVQCQFECLKCHMQTRSATLPELVHRLRLPRSKSNFLQSTTSDGPAAHLATMLHDSFTCPTVISKACEQCGVDTYHSKLDTIVARAGAIPELVISIMRFNAEQKLRDSVTLPSTFLIVPGHSSLYFIKYIAIHDGESVNYGHYFSFERRSLAQVHDAHQDNMASNSDDDHPKPSALFDTWTKYEDNKKFPGQKLAAIQHSHGQDIYIVQLTPASESDVEVLISTNELVESSLLTIADALRDYEGSVEDAPEMLGAHMADAILTSLRAAYDQLVHSTFPQQARRVNDDIWMSALARVLGRAPEPGYWAYQLPMFLISWLKDIWAKEIDNHRNCDNLARLVLERMLSPPTISRLIFEVSRRFAAHYGKTPSKAASTLTAMTYEAVEKQQRAIENSEEKQRRELVNARAYANTREGVRRDHLKQFLRMRHEDQSNPNFGVEEALHTAQEDCTPHMALAESLRGLTPGNGSAAYNFIEPKSPEEQRLRTEHAIKEMTHLLQLEEPHGITAERTDELRALLQRMIVGPPPPNTQGHSTTGIAGSPSQNQQTPSSSSSVPCTHRSQGRPIRGRGGAGRSEDILGTGCSRSRTSNPNATRNGSPAERSARSSKTHNTQESGRTSAKTASGQKSAAAKPSLRPSPTRSVQRTSPPFTAHGSDGLATPPSNQQHPLSGLAGLAEQYLARGTESGGRPSLRKGTPPRFDLRNASAMPGTPTSHLPHRPSPHRPHADSDDQPRISHPSNPSGRQTPYATNGSPRHVTTAEQRPGVSAGQPQEYTRLRRGLNTRNRSPEDPFTDDHTASTGIKCPADVPDDDLRNNDFREYSQADDRNASPSDRQTTGTWTNRLKKKASYVRNSFVGSLRRGHRPAVQSGTLPSLQRKKSTSILSTMYTIDEPNNAIDRSYRADKPRRRTSAGHLLSLFVPRDKAPSTTAVQRVSHNEFPRPEAPIPTDESVAQRSISAIERPPSSHTIIRHFSESQGDVEVPQSDAEMEDAWDAAAESSQHTGRSQAC